MQGGSLAAAGDRGAWLTPRNPPIAGRPQVANGGGGEALRREFKLLVREAHRRGIEVCTTPPCPQGRPPPRPNTNARSLPSRLKTTSLRLAAALRPRLITAAWQRGIRGAVHSVPTQSPA